MGPVEKTIIDKLNDAFQPTELRMLNESSKHAGPGTETHFQVFMISTAFQGTTRVQRQRTVFDLLASELEGPVHALSMRVLTPDEWDRLGNKVMPDSPNCAGGSKR